jgi:diguanylate cyclase (GGDEF)-like protein
MVATKPCRLLDNRSMRHLAALCPRRLAVQAMLCLGLLLCLIVARPQAQAAEHLRLGSDLAYAIYIDDSAKLGIDQIARLPSSAFKPVHGGLALSYTHSAAWLRFELPPSATPDKPWWLEIQPPILDSIELYQAQADGWHVRRAGDRLPYRQRELVHRFFIFELAPSSPGAPQPLFLRIETSSSLYLQANLWSMGALIEQSDAAAMHWGLYFGAFAIAMSFMIAMVAIKRSRQYLALTVALLVNGLHVANSQGFLVGWLWPDSPTWGDASIGITSPLAIASTLWALRELLVRDSGRRWLDRGYLAAIGYSLLVPSSLPFDHYRTAMPIALLLNLLGTIGALTLAFSRHPQRRGFARVMRLALSIYFIAYLATFLQLFGLIPTSPSQALLRSSMFIFFPLLASTALLLEIRQTYRHLVHEKSQALARSLATEHELEQRVAERTAELQQANRQLAALSTTDGLTGLANRRHFDEVLAEEWARAIRSGQPLALIMLDVDRFKKFNDHYGHQAGDDCLKQVAHCLDSHARRAGDLAARYGGEEFVLIAANTDAPTATQLAEDIRQSIAAQNIAHTQAETGRVTVSLGVAVLTPTPQQEPHLLLHAADDALYRAKHGGRNRVILADTAQSMPATQLCEKPGV